MVDWAVVFHIAGFGVIPVELPQLGRQMQVGRWHWWHFSTWSCYLKSSQAQQVKVVEEEFL